MLWLAFIHPILFLCICAYNLRALQHIPLMLYVEEGAKIKREKYFKLFFSVRFQNVRLSVLRHTKCIHRHKFCFQMFHYHISLVSIYSLFIHSRYPTNLHSLCSNCCTTSSCYLNIFIFTFANICLIGKVTSLFSSEPSHHYYSLHLKIRFFHLFLLTKIMPECITFSACFHENVR